MPLSVGAGLERTRAKLIDCGRIIKVQVPYDTSRLSRNHLNFAFLLDPITSKLSSPIHKLVNQ